LTIKCAPSAPSASVHFSGRVFLVLA
jgi:hypothetical protein